MRPRLGAEAAFSGASPLARERALRRSLRVAPIVVERRIERKWREIVRVRSDPVRERDEAGETPGKFGGTVRVQAATGRTSVRRRSSSKAKRAASMQSAVEPLRLAQGFARRRRRCRNPAAVGRDGPRWPQARRLRRSADSAAGSPAGPERIELQHQAGGAPMRQSDRVGARPRSKGRGPQRLDLRLEIAGEFAEIVQAGEKGDQRKVVLDAETPRDAASRARRALCKCR